MNNIYDEMAFSQFGSTVFHMSSKKPITMQ